MSADPKESSSGSPKNSADPESPVLATVTAEGEFARTLAQVATELFSVIRSFDDQDMPELRQPTPAELSDAETALRRLHEFLQALEARP